MRRIHVWTLEIVLYESVGGLPLLDTGFVVNPSAAVASAAPSVATLLEPKSCAAPSAGRASSAMVPKGHSGELMERGIYSVAGAASAANEWQERGRKVCVLKKVYGLVRWMGVVGLNGWIFDGCDGRA